MQFLETNEIKAWCTERGFELGLDGRPVWDRVWESIELVRHDQAAKPTGGKGPLAAECVSVLGSWDECLLWITASTGEPSNTNSSFSDETRTVLREERPLNVALGHVFSRGEKAALVDFVRLMLENPWDAHILPVREGQKTGVRAFLSRDEWLEFYKDARRLTGK